MKEVLHQDHGTVDDDAEVHRAHGEQVRGHTAHLEIEERGEQGEGYDRGDDQRGLNGKQEQEQDDHDQHRTLDEVAEHGLEGGVDELGAIVEGRNLDAARQNPLVDRRDPLPQCAQAEAKWLDSSRSWRHQLHPSQEPWQIH